MRLSELPKDIPEADLFRVREIERRGRATLTEMVRTESVYTTGGLRGPFAPAGRLPTSDGGRWQFLGGRDMMPLIEMGLIEEHPDNTGEYRLVEYLRHSPRGLYTPLWPVRSALLIQVLKAQVTRERGRPEARQTRLIEIGNIEIRLREQEDFPVAEDAALEAASHFLNGDKDRARKLTTIATSLVEFPKVDLFVWNEPAIMAAIFVHVATSKELRPHHREYDVFWTWARSKCLEALRGAKMMAEVQA